MSRKRNMMKDAINLDYQEKQWSNICTPISVKDMA